MVNYIKKNVKILSKDMRSTDEEFICRSFTLWDEHMAAKHVHNVSVEVK